jgi:hypothetical protein
MTRHAVRWPSADIRGKQCIMQGPSSDYYSTKACTDFRSGPCTLPPLTSFFLVRDSAADLDDTSLIAENLIFFGFCIRKTVFSKGVIRLAADGMQQSATNEAFAKAKY